MDGNSNTSQYQQGAVGEDDNFPPTEIQAAEIKSLFEQNHQDRIALSQSWWSKWTLYVNYENTRRWNVGKINPVSPGPVKLTGENDPSRKMISIEVYQKLVGWYGSEAAPFIPHENPQNYLNLIVWNIDSRIWYPLSIHPKASINQMFYKAFTPSEYHRMGTWRLFDPNTDMSFYSNDTRPISDVSNPLLTALCILPTDFAEMPTSGRLGKMGLVNLGNTCYMNASLQCLLRLPELMQHFLSREYAEEIKVENAQGTKGAIVNAFYDLMSYTWESDTSSIAPADFWEQLSGYNALFSNHGQHDTGEFTETVLDAFMEDCYRGRLPKPYLEKMNDEGDDEQMAEYCWNYHWSRSNSFATELFHGQYRTLTQCPNCPHPKRSFETFTILHVGLPPIKGRFFMFTAIDVVGNNKPVTFALEVDSKATIEELYKQLGSRLQFETTTPWAMMYLVTKTTMQDFHITETLKKLDDNEEILVFYYGASKYGPCCGGNRTLVFFSKEQYRRGYRQSDRSQMPFLPLWLPSTFKLELNTCRNILEGELNQFLRPFVKESQSSYRNILRFASGYRDSRNSSQAAYRITDSRQSGSQSIFVEWEQGAENRYFTDLYGCSQKDNQSLQELKRKRQVSNEFTLQECIQYECLPHESKAGQGSEWKCPSCNQMVNATKTTTLCRAPKILIIGLKRFDYDDNGETIKRENPITFPLECLDLRSEFKDQSNPAVYDLHGVCYHSGPSPQAGHYTSCVKSPGNAWHEYDDAKCTKTKPEKIVTPNAYLLFYRRKDLGMQEDVHIISEARNLRKARDETKAKQIFHNEILPSLSTAQRLLPDPQRPLAGCGESQSQEGEFQDANMDWHPSEPNPDPQSHAVIDSNSSSPTNTAQQEIIGHSDGSRIGNLGGNDGHSIDEANKSFASKRPRDINPTRKSTPHQNREDDVRKINSIGDSGRSLLLNDNPQSKSIANDDPSNHKNL